MLSNTRFFSQPAICACLLLGSGTLLLGQNVVSVTGHGEAPVDPKDKKTGTEKAMARAQDAARTDAVAQVIAKVYGNKSRLGAKADEIIQQVAQRSEGAIRDRIPKLTEVRDGKAIVEIEFLIERLAIKTQLEEIHDVSLAGEAKGKLKVYVVAYTVKGEDPDPTKPILLHDEVTDNRQNVNRNSFAGSRTDASSKSASASASLQASASSSNKGDSKYQSDGKFQGSNDTSASYKGSESAKAGARVGDARANASYDASAEGKFSSETKVKGEHSDSGSQSWDNRSAASLDARSAEASSSASFKQRSASGSSFSDTSTQYHSLKVYADPTKKGLADTNDIKYVLEELLKNAQLDLYDLDDLPINAKEPPSDEKLKTYVINSLKRRSDISKDAFVAIAINRLTPTAKQQNLMSAKVSFQIRRIEDGSVLWSKSESGASEPSSSQDEASLQATKFALRKIGAEASPALDKALKDWQAGGRQKVQTQEREYTIKITEANNPSVAAKFIAALKAAGFTPTRTFDGASRMVQITVELNGKRGEEAQTAIEPLLDNFDVDRMDASQTILRVK